MKHLPRALEKHSFNSLISDLVTVSPAWSGGGGQFHLHGYVGGREQVGRPCRSNASTLWPILEHSVWVLYVGGIQCNPEWMVARKPVDETTTQ